MYFVYELVDPRTDTTGYVGITNNPNLRYYEHIEGRVGKGKKYEWIKGLQDEQVQPKMKILEIVDDLEQARKQERYWIQRYLSQGTQLANTHFVKTLNNIPDKKATYVARAKHNDDVDAITEKLRQQILQGDFGTQGRLPSISMLSKQYNIKREIIDKAFQQLETEGLLISYGTSRGFVSLGDKLTKYSIKLV